MFVFSVFTLRMSKFFFQLVIVINVFACVWYFTACPLNECSDDPNWVAHQGKCNSPLNTGFQIREWSVTVKFLLFSGGGELDITRWSGKSIRAIEFGPKP